MISGGRKGIIHCATIDLVYRVLSYLISIHKGNINPLRRFRPYFSICPDDYNERTLYLLDHDPYCQLVIATIAFTNGLNSRSIQDSISLAPAETVDLLIQEKGRVGRTDDKVIVKDSGITTAARGIIFITKRIINRALKFLAGVFYLLIRNGPDFLLEIEAGKVPTSPMDHSLALFLTEIGCYVTFLNRLYQDSPLEDSTKTCIDAGRLLPCSLCLKKLGRTLTFVAPPSPAGITSYPPLQAPPKSKRTKTKKTSNTELKKMEKLERALIDFGDKIWQAERNQNHNLPRYAFFPQPLITQIVASYKTLKTVDELRPLLAADEWPFIETYSEELLEVITRIRIPPPRKTQQLPVPTDTPEAKSQTTTHKRGLFQNTTNEPPAKQPSRNSKLESVAVTTASYGPIRKKCRR